MGHRCLVAYETDEGYRLHYSHWGGSADLPLVDEIKGTAPFGNGSLEPNYVNELMASVNEAADSADMEVEGKLTEAQRQEMVDPDPVAVVADLPTAASEFVDFLHHETFYVVNQKYEVRAFRTWRLLPEDTDDPMNQHVGHGVLFEPPKRDGSYKRLGHYGGVENGLREAAKTLSDDLDYDRQRTNVWLIDAFRTKIREWRATIPEFSPHGHPAQNRRRGGFATSEIPFPEEGDVW